MSEKVLLIDDVSIGADPEMFLIDINTNDVVSAEGIIRGTKHAPYLFKKDNHFFATSLDNVMAEFTIPPAKKKEEFSMNLLEAMNYVANTIPKHLRIFTEPSAIFLDDYLKTDNAKLFGCDPDYNAWKLGMINPVPNGQHTNLRTCGGHVHIGYNQPDHDVNMALIRAMDIYLGLPSIIQEPDNKRKELYGKAGAFRHKDYGVEYRTLSNYYLKSENLMNWVYDNTLKAIGFVNERNVINLKEGDAIQSAINNNDKELAQTLCKYFGVKLAA